jgi:hypothetical protein
MAVIFTILVCPDQGETAVSFVPCPGGVREGDEV